MVQKIERNQKERKPSLSPEIRQEIITVFLLTISLVGILSLFGLAGRGGNHLAKFLTSIFGYSAAVFIIILITSVYLLINFKKHSLKTSNFLGLFLFILSFTGFFNLLVENGGGYLGYYFSYPFKKFFGGLSSFIFLFALLSISLLLIFEFSFAKIFGAVKAIFDKIKNFFGEPKFKIKFFKNSRVLEEPSDFAAGKDDFASTSAEKEEIKRAETGLAPKRTKSEQLNFFSKTKDDSKKIEVPLELLDSKETKPTAGDTKANKLIIQKTLENFGIPVEMGEVNIGPTVSQYTLKPFDGVKLSQITTLHNDLSLSLAAHPIRIEAPIPGKSLVGIEIPNQSTATVRLKELLNNGEFKNRKSNLTLALGKDVSGKSYLADLERMPHLLIAGATGSGKTVMLNSIILSLFFQNHYDDLKLILIDPKRVELTAFDDLPYLLTPVIVNVEKTINALRWTVKEMERRFDVFSKAKRRDIASYNRDSGEKLPYLVLLIDELADLMTAAPQEIENCIIRLAQMARATGIHLIMATQRPSVDIITGLIKANITCRIAFSVASITDSRTILDFSGAEKLLGRGDMLYVSPELGKPKRLQGAYLSDKEIQNVVNYLKNQAEPDYLPEVTQKLSEESSMNSFVSSEEDELLPQAKEVIIRAQKASASLLQRRLRIGYARAARLLDLLEEQGMIGPADGAKPREVLIRQKDDLNEETKISL